MLLQFPALLQHATATGADRNTAMWVAQSTLYTCWRHSGRSYGREEWTTTKRQKGNLKRASKVRNWTWIWQHRCKPAHWARHIGYSRGPNNKISDDKLSTEGDKDESTKEDWEKDLITYFHNTAQRFSRFVSVGWDCGHASRYARASAVTTYGDRPGLQGTLKM